MFPRLRLPLALKVLSSTLLLMAAVSLAEPRAADDDLEALLSAADAALIQGWLVEPDGLSALDLYQQALQRAPDNNEAQAGLNAVYHAALEAARLRARELDFEAAVALIRAAERIDPDSASFTEALNEVDRLRQAHIESAEQETRSLIAAGHFSEAEDEITDLIASGLERSRVRALRRALSQAQTYGSYRPGQTLRDPLHGDPDRLGPEMVVVPSGHFMMGSPESEAGRSGHEGPRHRVVIQRGFALGLTEITVGQFAEFVEETSYVSDAERTGWASVYEPRSGRMNRRRQINWRHDYLGRAADADLPVIHVSWRDARAYADWLARASGRAYRLPSEAEFEYALRADSQTRYWWGDGTPDEALENLTGDGDLSPTGLRWNTAFARYRDGHWGPAPVASFPTNPFGLHDMGGNVMEWVEDCWHDSFVRAPADGSAWVNPGCDLRVIRGGSWSSTPDMSRSAYRLSGREGSADMRVGFRVARDL